MAGNSAPSGPVIRRDDEECKRAQTGPQDTEFFLHERVNVMVSSNGKEQTFVEGDIIEITQSFYTVKYNDPRPGNNIEGKDYCERHILKNNYRILSRISPYVMSQSHASKGPDKSTHNAYTINAPLKPPSRLWRDAMSSSAQPSVARPRLG